MAKNRVTLSAEDAPVSANSTLKRRARKLTKPFSARELGIAANRAVEWPTRVGHAWTFDADGNPVTDYIDVTTRNMRFGCPALQIARFRKVAKNREQIRAILSTLILKYSEATNGGDYVTDMHFKPKSVAKTLRLMAAAVKLGVRID